MGQDFGMLCGDHVDNPFKLLNLLLDSQIEPRLFSQCHHGHIYKTVQIDLVAFSVTEDNLSLIY